MTDDAELRADCLAWIDTHKGIVTEDEIFPITIAELKGWSQQVHEALDGKPIVEPDEGPQRILTLKATIARRENG